MEQKTYLDQREIVRIVETHSDMLLRIAINRVQSMTEAEDIVQAVYLRLMTNQPRFKSPEHERAWLIRTAINLCLDYHKSASRRTSVPLPDDIAAAQPEENGADLFFGIKRFIDDYNYHRRHQGINRTVPSKLYIRQAAWS